MLPLDQQSVALDGDAVRSIREQKRLTQFYVSKVVGVTTDTVSRWENNRYPTIKRENAVKLADALEVELIDILKRDVQVSSVIEPHHNKSVRLWLVAGFGVLLAGFVFLWFVMDRSSPVAAPLLDAERIVPAYAAPGSQFLVHVSITTEALFSGMILKETLPSGLQFVSAEPEATSIDVERGIVRWIFRQPVVPMKVVYRLQVARELPLGSALGIVGEVITNPEGQQSIQPIESTAPISIAPVHWADTNGNMVIDDLEILAFSELLEGSSVLEGEWELLEELWHAGGYFWDSEQFQFRPVTDADETKQLLDE